MPKCAARRREPAPALSDRKSARDPRAIAAMERRKARRPPYGPVISGPACRRSALPRGGPPGASVKRTSAVQRSIPLTFLKGTTDKARPARRYKRAAELWLFEMRIGNLGERDHAAKRKAPAGRAGGREGPDLRGDEEAWIGRPTGEDRPGQVEYRRSILCDRLSSSGHLPALRRCDPSATARSTAHPEARQCGAD